MPTGCTQERKRASAYVHTPRALAAAVRITSRSHLQLGKLLRLVAGVLGIDELGEEELVEVGALRKKAMSDNGRGRRMQTKRARDDGKRIRPS